MGKETEIQAQIISYLRINGFFVWRNPTQGLRINGGVRIKNPNSGAPDIMAVKDGEFFGIEVKTKTGVISPEQKAWAENAAKFGAKIIIARSLDDVIFGLQS